jgi:hypothetical protein
VAATREIGVPLDNELRSTLGLLGWTLVDRTTALPSLAAICRTQIRDAKPFAYRTTQLVCLNRGRGE